MSVKKYLGQPLYWRIGVPLLVLFLSIGVVTERISEGGQYVTLLLAMSVPFFWPRFRLWGDWWGLALLFGATLLLALSIKPGQTVLVATTLVWGMLLALAISPAAFVLFLWQRRGTGCVAMISYAVFPLFFYLFLNRLGDPTKLDITTANVTDLFAGLVWMWYVLSGFCLGIPGFLVGLLVLLLKESRGASIGIRPTQALNNPPEAMH